MRPLVSSSPLFRNGDGFPILIYHVKLCNFNISSISETKSMFRLCIFMGAINEMHICIVLRAANVVWSTTRRFGVNFLHLFIYLFICFHSHFESITLVQNTN